MRRTMIGAFVLSFGFLAGDALVQDQDLIDDARGVLVVIAALSAIYWLATTAVLRPRLPSLRLHTAGPGFSVQVLPPEKGRVGRLRQETDDVVTEIHSYLKTAHGLGSTIDSAWSAGKTGAEAQREILDAFERDRQTINEQFGGKVEYLLSAYEAKGLLAEKDKDRLLWSLGSNHWLVDVARKLEAMRLQL